VTKLNSKEGNAMLSILQNRAFKRVIMLALAIVIMIGASWRVGAVRNSTLRLADADLFVSGADARTNTSVDTRIQTLQHKLQADPNDWQAYSQLGLAYLQKARETGDPTYYQRTEEALNKASSFQPGDYTTLSAQAALALARHQFRDALELGEQARQIDPERAYAYGVMADAQIELGQYSGAVETLQRMVDLRPDMSSYSRISYLRELHGDSVGAIDMMQLAVDSGTPSAENTAWSRTQLATLYFNTGNLERAELEFRRTLQDRPNYVYAIAGLGRVRAVQGDTEQAIELLTQAIAIMPLPEFVIMLGDLYQTTGQQGSANQQYRLLATIEHLYRANGVDMDMEIALFNADHDQHLIETLDLARRAYENRPSIHGADALAWVLFKNGHYEEAEKYSEEALQLGTQDALKLFHAGMIALKLGDEPQARQYLEQVLMINPHFSILHAEEARRTLQTLQKAAGR
jgi:tetratricopeptide (TPR) repeat protein